MQIAQRAAAASINLRLDRIASHQTIGISLDECTSEDEVNALWRIVLGTDGESLSVSEIDKKIELIKSVIPLRPPA